MSLIRNSTQTEKAEGSANSVATMVSSKTNQTQKEHVFGISTIDGGMVNFNAGSQAISNGSGIFIGDYFVGICDSYQSVSNLPFVRY